MFEIKDLKREDLQKILILQGKIRNSSFAPLKSEVIV